MSCRHYTEMRRTISDTGIFLIWYALQKSLKFSWNCWTLEMLEFSSKALNDSLKILPALVPVVSCHILWGFIDVTVCSDYYIFVV